MRHRRRQHKRRGTEKREGEEVQHFAEEEEMVANGVMVRSVRGYR